MVKYLFKSGQEPYCTGNGDIDQSGELNISDLTMFVNFFFKNGTSPVDCQ